MRYGFSLVVRGADATPDGFTRVAQRVESLGFDSLWLSAHVIVPPQERSWYNMVEGRKHPPHWREGYWEPFTVLAYLAALTERITLGTSVVVLPMHNPIELAKQVAEVDVLSGGRLVFGVGVGWFEEEFEVLGRPFRNRGARTDDALELMRALWTEEPVTHEGRFHSVRDCSFLPKPVQRPHPPVWIAGNGDPALRRAARFGQAFHPVRIDPERLAAVKTTLSGYCEEAGRARDAAELAVKLPLVFQDGPPASGQLPTQGRPRDVVDGIRRYQDIGVSHMVLDFVPETVPVALDTMERFAQEVRPHL
jgi:probable F420-dependent oxidoreductase